MSNLDALSPAEKKALATTIASIRPIIFPGPEEYSFAELIDDAIAYAKAKLKAGEWHQDTARLRIAMALEAATLHYSIYRKVDEEKIRSALNAFLYGIAGILNERIGVDIFPQETPETVIPYFFQGRTEK